MQCICSPWGIQMQLYKGAPSFAQQSSRFCSDIIQPRQPPCCVLSMCAALLGVGEPHPFAAFSVVAGIQPWEIAQDTLNEPSFLGKKEKHVEVWRAAGCWGQQKPSNSSKGWIQRSRQHTGPSLHSTAARSTEGLCGPVAQGYCSEVMCRGSGHQPQWPRLPHQQVPHSPVPQARSSVRDLPTAGLGMVLSPPGSLQGTHTPSHLGLTVPLPGVIHWHHQLFPMPAH